MNNYIILNKKIEGNKVGFLILLFNFYENFYFNNFGRLSRTINYFKKRLKLK